MGSSSALPFRAVAALRRCLGLWCVLCAFPLAVLGLPAHAARPNVVIIVADDLGWNDVGFHGSEIRTPTLDAMAQEGVQLTRFYVQSSCSPTRSELMSGRSALALGITAPFSKLQPAGLPLGERLLPEYFQEAGYQTLMVGKWHLGFRQPEYLPNQRGFEHFYGNLTGGVGYWDHVHGGGLDWQRNGQTVREEGYATHLQRNEAVRLVRQRDPDKPFLLYLAFSAAHLPNEAPPEALAQYTDIADHKRRTHAAMVSEMDAAIGALIATLQAEQLLNDTLIWFFSDNGGLNPGLFPAPLRSVVTVVDDWLGARELPFRALEFVRMNVLDGASDNSPLRGGKQSVYEGGIRVPALVYWPGTLQPAVSHELVTAADVLHTLLSAAELPPVAQPGTGLDRWSSLRGAAVPRPADYVVAGADGEALIRYPWKLVAPKSAALELYHLDDDPGERRDLAAAQPQMTETLAAALRRAPRGEPLNIPLWRAVFDPDFFGGVEDRRPWSEIHGSL